MLFHHKQGQISAVRKFPYHVKILRWWKVVVFFSPSLSVPSFRLFSSSGSLLDISPSVAPRLSVPLCLMLANIRCTWAFVRVRNSWWWGVAVMLKIMFWKIASRVSWSSVLYAGHRLLLEVQALFWNDGEYELANLLWKKVKSGHWFSRWSMFFF